ncbi:RNA-dependent RNA polymerase [Theobroma cacao]|nr:RNA-dependent RNA polymerase [Theobroma cacao]
MSVMSEDVTRYSFPSTPREAYIGLSTLCMSLETPLVSGIEASQLVGSKPRIMDLELAILHYMTVDFAKTGAPVEMPQSLKPREFPDFMQRVDKPMYAFFGVLAKLYRATINSTVQARSKIDRRSLWIDLQEHSEARTCDHLQCVLILSMDKHLRAKIPHITIEISG